MADVKFQDLAANSLDGKPVPMSKFDNQVVLVVNVASKCGFTPQYTGLEALYQKYKDRGFTVLGFPCNQFGAQEPGSAEEIKSFCSVNYPVTFPIFDKVEVNGENAHPVFRFLRGEAKGVLGTEGIKWNFTKFLVDRHGHVVTRFAPTTKPEDLDGDISKLL